jgi:hypothetical protein
MSQWFLSSAFSVMDSLPAFSSPRAHRCLGKYFYPLDSLFRWVCLSFLIQPSLPSSSFSQDTFRTTFATCRTRSLCYTPKSPFLCTLTIYPWLPNHRRKLSEECSVTIPKQFGTMTSLNKILGLVDFGNDDDSSNTTVQPHDPGMLAIFMCAPHLLNRGFGSSLRSLFLSLFSVSRFDSDLFLGYGK